MTKTTLTILFSTLILTVFSQQFNRCEISQYIGADSTKIAITKIITYDELGRITTEKCTGFKLSSTNNSTDNIYFYEYKDSLLTSRISTDMNNDSTKTIYKYSKNGILKKQIHYDFKRRLKKNTHKGLGERDGCLISETDYEKEKTWEKSSVIHYKYDKQNNKIEYYAPKLHWDRQNRYTWKYDNQNRIIEHCSYENKRLIWKEIYNFSNDSFNFTLTWYDYYGNPEHLKETTWEYKQQKTHSYKLDKFGRKVEEMVTNEKGEILSRTITEYNELGLIHKEITYNKNNQPEITNIYIYRN